jgi:hypothetical protein
MHPGGFDESRGATFLQGCQHEARYACSIKVQRECRKAACCCSRDLDALIYSKPVELLVQQMHLRYMLCCTHILITIPQTYSYESSGSYNTFHFESTMSSISTPHRGLASKCERPVLNQVQSSLTGQSNDVVLPRRAAGLSRALCLESTRQLKATLRLDSDALTVSNNLERAILWRSPMCLYNAVPGAGLILYVQSRKCVSIALYVHKRVAIHNGFHRPNNVLVQSEEDVAELMRPLSHQTVIPLGLQPCSCLGAASGGLSSYGP